MAGHTLVPWWYYPAMTKSTEQVLEDAMRLDSDERATLAALLIESLEEGPDEGVDEAWAAEIQRRIADLDSSAVLTVPWNEVRARLNRLLNAENSPVPPAR